MKNSVLFTIVFVLLVAAQTNATPITIQINGVVEGIDNREAYPYQATIYAGVPFTGTYTYDSATIGTGNYVHNSPYGFNIVLGGFEFKTVESHVGQFRITLRNDYSLQPYDEYLVVSSQNTPLSTGLSVNSITWDLYDNKHTALSSTILPSDAPNLNTGVWSSNRFLIGCGSLPNDTLFIWGTVTQAVVPEPLTGILMTVGILFLRGRR